ncbi:hypothetical protein JCM19992_32190 [Thermostilla marina]
MRFVQILQRFVREDEAATAVEYAVMLAFILMACIGAISSFGSETGGLWSGITGDLSSVGFIP